MVYKDIIDHRNKLERLELGEDCILSELDQVLSHRDELKLMFKSPNNKLEDVQKGEENSQRKIHKTPKQIEAKTDGYWAVVKST